MSRANGPEVIEVEAEPVGADEAQPGGRARPSGAALFGGAFGPLLAGVLLDMADLATPLGLGKLGIVVGALAGWWIGGALALSPGRRLLLTAAGAAYCAAPGTSRLPLGTVAGALSRLVRARA